MKRFAARRFPVVNGPRERPVSVLDHATRRVPPSEYLPVRFPRGHHATEDPRHLLGALTNPALGIGDEYSDGQPFEQQRKLSANAQKLLRFRYAALARLQQLVFELVERLIEAASEYAGGDDQLADYSVSSHRRFPARQVRIRDGNRSRRTDARLRRQTASGLAAPVFHGRDALAAAAESPRSIQGTAIAWRAPARRSP